MAQRNSKGGPRRHKVEDVCGEHLFDSLAKWVQVHGDNAFEFGEYATLTKSQGASIPDLVRLSGLLEILMDISGGLEFKYSVLKEVFGRLIAKYPGLKSNIGLAKQSTLSGDSANSIMTLCTHARRLRSAEFLAQCLRKCTHWQGKSLEKLHKFLCAHEGHDPVLPCSSSTSLHSASIKVQHEEKEEAEEQEEKEEDEDMLPSTQDILDLNIPGSQESQISLDSKQLLLEALNSPPVPPRKADVKKVIMQKKPAAQDLSKKPAASIAKTSSIQNYIFQSSSFGKCKAEFYSYKSYIRRFDEVTQKWTLVIQVEGKDHEKKLQALVSHAQKAKATKEKLVAIRATL